VPPSCALLGGFAIGALVSLLCQHRAEREMSASACTRSMPVGLIVSDSKRTVISCVPEDHLVKLVPGVGENFPRRRVNVRPRDLVT